MCGHQLQREGRLRGGAIVATVMSNIGLELALRTHGIDLVRTAVAPTWDDISKLAVIATIRTMLNYFLAKDIADFSAAKQSAGTPPPG